MTVAVLAGCGNKADQNANAKPEESGQTEATDTTEADTSAQEGEESSEPAAAELDTSKQVEIVMYYLGTEPAGQQVIWDKLNEILLERLNCTLKVNFISAGTEGGVHGAG